MFDVSVIFGIGAAHWRLRMLIRSVTYVPSVVSTIRLHSHCDFVANTVLKTPYSQKY